MKKEINEKEQSLKKKYGNITKMTFKVEDDKILTAYIRQPNLTELDATLASLQSSPISSSVGLFNTCFVDGDKELMELSNTNSGLAIAINKQIQSIIPNVFGESTNL